MRNTYPFDWGLWARLSETDLIELVNAARRLGLVEFCWLYPESLRADGRYLPAPLSFLWRVEPIAADEEDATDGPLVSSDLFGIGYISARAEESRSYLEPKEYLTAAFQLTESEIQALPWPLYPGQPLTLRDQEWLILFACGNEFDDVSPDRFFIRLTTAECLNPDY